MENNIIFTDFDGVLFNTVKEAYLLSRYAYYGIDFYKSIDMSNYHKFYKYRYLITNSWQFYYILQLIENNISTDTFENIFNKMINESDKSSAKIFDNKYIKGRENLIKNNFTFWDELDKPFKFFFDLVKFQKENNIKVIVLTNKKKLPVVKKLQKYRAQDFEVFANEDLVPFKNKVEFIKNYMNTKTLEKVYFIEDSMKNLSFCKTNTKICPFLVNWGYLSPKDQGLSSDEILTVIKEQI